MPPKKKGKEKKKMKQNDEGNEHEEKYRRSLLDVAILKEHLALRTDVALHAKASREELKKQLGELESDLSQERTNKRDITADLNRRHKIMQTDMEAKISHLEIKVITLQQQLAQCQGELRDEREAHTQDTEEKEAIISRLQSKLDNMESEYEKILHGSLDSLLTHLTEARGTWEEESAHIHQDFKDILKDFGLNALQI
ncbi:coiled-coil domain-containing protein 153 [Clupea harengus]|uniref:Dynein regulatory complex protein 12 n=1 Tax=Clupea harengus TaxID=7950 RepID=A0A6P8GVZ5_CLUHA|nr:coiled-coil domain-containing protein 153 [Clupea harengus]